MDNLIFNLRLFARAWQQYACPFLGKRIPSFRRELESIEVAFRNGEVKTNRPPLQLT